MESRFRAIEAYVSRHGGNRNEFFAIECLRNPRLLCELDVAAINYMSVIIVVDG